MSPRTDRALLVAALLCACSSSPSDPPDDAGYTAVADASEELCPLLHAPGVTGARWFSRGGCAYSCDPVGYQVCGVVFADDGTVARYGTCVARDDHDNCGRCGSPCGASERCVSGAAGYYCGGR